MNVTRRSGKVSIVMGGLLVGWGLAMVAFASPWAPLHTALATLRQIAPVWLWGIAALALGIFILSRAKQVPSGHASSNHASVEQSQSNPQERSNELTPNGSVTSTNGSMPQVETDSSKPHIAQPHIAQPHIAQPNESRPTNYAPRITNHESPANGPKIVAIGGGTGMPQLLRGLRAYTENITAVVTVADDGGSSGRLRVMGVLPPGDFRNNIAALSDSEDLITRLFQYRFAQKQLPSSSESKNDALPGNHTHDDLTGLAGHNFGNLFIATMAAVTGSFESGLAESSRVLAVRGRILPSTLEQVTLCAEVKRERSDGSPNRASVASQSNEEWLLVEGESKIPEAGGTIQRVFLKPQSPRAYPEAIRAILQADLILAGPGSFFTSILPNLLVPAVRDAILASGAPSIYLCNITTQSGETDYYSVSTHMHQLRLHAGDALTNVLANSVYDPQIVPGPNSQWVTLPREDRSSGYISDIVDGNVVEYRLFTAPLVNEAAPSMHDSGKLATEVMNAFSQLKNEALKDEATKASSHERRDS